MNPRKALKKKNWNSKSKEIKEIKNDRKDNDLVQIINLIINKTNCEPIIFHQFGFSIINQHY